MDEVRCDCRANRLLAQIIEGKHTYLLVRSFKSQKMLSEVRLYVGVTEILCTSCGRYTRLTVRRDGVNRR